MSSPPASHATPAARAVVRLDRSSAAQHATCSVLTLSLGKTALRMGCCASVSAESKEGVEPPRILSSSSFNGESFGLYAEAVSPRMLRLTSEKKFSFDRGRKERALSLHSVKQSRTDGGGSTRTEAAAISDADAQVIVHLLTSVKAPLVLFASSVDCEPESEILAGLASRGTDPFVVDMGDPSRLSDQPLWTELRARADSNEKAVPVLYCRGTRISGSSASELLASLDSYLRSSEKRVLRIGELEVYDASVDAWVTGEVELRTSTASGETDWLFAAFDGRFGGKVTTHFSAVSAARPSGDEFSYDPQRLTVECRGGEVIQLRAANEEDAAAWLQSLQTAAPDPASDNNGDDKQVSCQPLLLQRWQQEVGQAAATEWLQELSSVLDDYPAASARIRYDGDGFLDVLDELDEDHTLFQASGHASKDPNGKAEPPANA